MVVQTRLSQELLRRRRSACPSPSPVEATQGLPDVDSLPLQHYRHAPEDGDQTCDLTYHAPRVNPRVCDYVVEPADWTTDRRERDPTGLWDNDAGAPQGANTVEAILGADIAGYLCEVCDEMGDACPGKQCVAIYKAFLASNEAKYLEIRDAGAMGMGVFATQAIKKGTILCEYTGRLFPLDAAVFPPDDGAYTWHVSGRCLVDGALDGNIGRFVNHHCTQYNCDPMDLVYGRRKVLAYRVERAISRGEQLYVNYGINYFVPSKPCRCSAVEYPHLLGPRGRVRRTPAKKMCWNAGKQANADTKTKTKAKAKKKKTSQSSSPETKLGKLTRRAGVAARSKL